MSSFPNMNGLEAEQLVERAVGKDIHLHVHEFDSASTTGRVQGDSRRLAREVARDMMKMAEMAEDLNMETFCAAVAAAAMGRLVTSSGFTVVYGDYFQPREIVRVELRPEGTRHTSIDATVQTVAAHEVSES